MDVVQVIRPDTDSHFLLLPCPPPCTGGVPVYEQYNTPAGMRWRVRCPACGATTDPKPYIVRHTVQLAWNRWCRSKEKEA